MGGVLKRYITCIRRILFLKGFHIMFANANVNTMQVETSIFALSFKNPPSPLPSEFDTSSCGLDLVLPLSQSTHICLWLIHYVEIF